MKKGADFLVVGSSTVDIMAKTSDVERIDISGRQVEKLVCISFASKSELEGLELHPGGSAANSAVMMATLGSSALLLSAVGDDAFGKLVLDDLRNKGVATKMVKVFRNMPTGVGIDIVSGHGEKSVLVYRGANNNLGSSDVPESAIKNSRHILITSLVSEANYGLFGKLISLAKKHHKPVVFAPSITMLHSWMPKLRKLKPHFDIVIMNYEEGRYYTGKGEIKGILAALPGRIAVLTRDVDGAYAVENKGKKKKFCHIQAVPVKVSDTMGAGDAFSGAFASSYYSSGSVSHALKVAAAAAALKLTHKGAHFSLRKAALGAFMKLNSSKMNVRVI